MSQTGNEGDDKSEQYLKARIARCAWEASATILRSMKELAEVRNAFDLMRKYNVSPPTEGSDKLVELEKALAQRLKRVLILDESFFSHHSLNVGVVDEHFKKIEAAQASLREHEQKKEG